MNDILELKPCDHKWEWQLWVGILALQVCEHKRMTLEWRLLVYILEHHVELLASVHILALLVHNDRCRR